MDDKTKANYNKSKYEVSYCMMHKDIKDKAVYRDGKRYPVYDDISLLKAIVQYALGGHIKL